MLVATGYLRMGPWEHTGMTQFVVSRQLYLDDITNNVRAGVPVDTAALRQMPRPQIRSHPDT